TIFFQAEDGIRDFHVTGVQTCALPISVSAQSSLEFVAGSHLGKQYNGKDYRGTNNPLYSEADMEPLPDIETQRERWNIVSWDIEIGRASCRESVEIVVGADSLEIRYEE